MAGTFLDTFLPAVTGELGKLPGATISGQMQGQQYARDLALLDMQIKQKQFELQKMQQPASPAFHNLGAGAFAIVDPKTGQPTRIDRPPQTLSSEAQMLGLMATPQGRQILQDYYYMKRGPEQPLVVPPGSTVLPRGGMPPQGEPSIQPAGGLPQTPQPYTAPSQQKPPIAFEPGQQIFNPNTQQWGTAPGTPKTKGTPGQTALDQAFAKDYADWVAGGGYSDIEKQLGQLRGASKALETDPSLTGPFVGMIPDRMRNITNPAAVAVRDQVLEVVQRNLRMILGPQFTEREGILLMKRAYNEQQTPAENKKRVDRLIKQIETAAKAKKDAGEYFEQHGTLQGWKGKLPSISDFNPEVANVGEGRINPSVKPASGFANKPRVVAPPVGAVVGGYRFIGGDPSKKESWSR